MPVLSAARGGRGWTTDDELDLRWYLCVAPSKAGGLRSNMGAQLEAAAYGLSHLLASVDVDLAMADRLDAAFKAAGIRRVLAALTSLERDVLATAYGEASSTRPVRTRFGSELAGVAHLLDPAAVRALDEGTLLESAVELARLHERAETALRNAQRSYAARRGLRGARS